MPSVEIIKRDSVHKYEDVDVVDVRKSQIISEKCQVSYNSHGHIAVRLINGESDTLLVFDQRTSQEIKNFCRKVFCKGNGKGNDIPF